MIIGGQATYNSEARKSIGALIELMKVNFPTAKIEILRRSDETYRLEKKNFKPPGSAKDFYYSPQCLIAQRTRTEFVSRLDELYVQLSL